MVDPRVRCCLVSGASASGKDHLCDLLEAQVKNLARDHDRFPGPVSFIHVAADMFYKELTPEQHEIANKGDYNFDVPSAIDSQHLISCVKQLSDMSRDHVELPIYDFISHKRKSPGHRIKLSRNDSRRVIVVQGIFVLCFEELRRLSNMNVFLRTDNDIVVLRRVQRDMKVRGQSVAAVIQQYGSVKRGFEQFVEPSGKQYADIQFPYVHVNPVLVEMLTLQLMFGKIGRDHHISKL